VTKPRETPPLHGHRRNTGGTRREASDRAVLKDGDVEVTGWTLNLSRGGVRLVIEQPVQPGAEYQVIIGDSAPRPGRVIWVQNEADGQIVGVQFIGVDGRAVTQSGIPGPTER
jgi:hypothetical protein